MKLASYGAFGAERAGLVDGERIVDLHAAMRAAGARQPVDDVRRLLELPDWKTLLAQAWMQRDAAPSVDIGRVRLGAPVPVPRKLLIAGANSHSHVAEAGAVLKDAAPPREPMILGKATSSLCGPFDAIVHPPETRKLDYEVELAVVIGRRARRIAEADVLDHLAGCSVINELSARDVQLAEHESNAFFRVHFVGKSYDTFSPMGPYLVTIDELDWQRPFGLRTWVNGTIRQSSDTRDLVFGVEKLVSYISQAMTLHPGDVIATGSPAGVGHFMQPPGYLRPGDIVRCEVEGVGAIENRVVAEPR